MLYTISTSWEHYKEGSHTRRLQKVWFVFEPVDDFMWERMWYNCKLKEREIQKDMTNDEVIKLSTKFSIILHNNEIKIYDWYIE